MAAEGGQVITCRSIDQWCDLLKKGKESKKMLVAEFTVSWCGPISKIMAPFVDELAKEFTDFMFLRVDVVDVDELTNVAAQWEVAAFPTFVFLKDGTKVQNLVRANKKALQKSLVELSGISS